MRLFFSSACHLRHLVIKSMVEEMEDTCSSGTPWEDVLLWVFTRMDEGTCILQTFHTELPHPEPFKLVLAVVKVGDGKNEPGIYLL